MKGFFKRSSNLLVSSVSWTGNLLNKDFDKALGMPVFLNIELTNCCNLRCPECATGSGLLKRPAGFMDIALFEKITDELRPYLMNLNLYFQGESMMHPDFFSILELSKGIPVTLSTNGHYLVNQPGRLISSGLRKLIVSVDGSDQNTYSAYRKGGNIETVFRGLEKIKEARKRTDSKMKVEIQMLVNSYNEHQIEEIRRIARLYNATFITKSMQVLSHRRIGYWMPSSESLKRYRLVNGEYHIKSKLPDRCARQWFNPVVTWEGKVVPCCFDKDAEYIMGDLTISTFREIWNGPEYRKFRREISANRCGIEMCCNCTSGLVAAKH
jgi:radical SAM protein with 4Fe4S-binding SPASM domain